MAVELHVLLLDGQGIAIGDADLLQDEVDVGDHLGHGMLDLDPRVHLDEIESAVLVEEFDGADAEIFEFAHGHGHGLADRLALRAVECGGGALLQDLLVAALQRAVALAEMDGAALAVAQHLDLDVAGTLEILLEIDGVVTECGLGLGARGRERHREISFAVRDLHAAPAATGRRLHQHGKADAGGRWRAPRPPR